MEETKDKITPVASAVKKEPSKNPLKKIFAEDAKSVGSKIVDDVVLPGFKRVMVDMITSAANWIFYGNGYVSNSKPGGIKGIGWSSGTEYNSLYNNKPSAMKQGSKANVCTVSDLLFADRGSAELVLTRLNEKLSKYGVVAVSDFYQLAEQSYDYTDERWGWRDLSGCIIVIDEDPATHARGYCIKFPKVTPLQ